jgi:pimeloyl-ACP methyl ester carboxylesterase
MGRMIGAVVRGIAIALIALLVLVALIGAAFRWQAERREIREAAKVAPLAGRYVRAGDVQAFIQEDGPEGEPVVVFVHGTGAWSGAWRRTLTEAGKAGFHVVAIDLPPFGFSTRPTSQDYGKVEQGRRIAGLLDTLGISRAILVGHSFGAGPTVEAALLAPDRVHAMVLVDGALGVRAAGEVFKPAPAVLRAVLAAPPIRDALVATFLTNPLFTRKLLEMFIDDPSRATENWVQIYQRPLVVQGSTEAISAWLPALLAPTGPAPSEDPATYRSLAMPVSLIWGERDSITPLAQGKAIAALLPKADLIVMDGVGHIPQIEDGEKFDQLLIAVLKRLAATH